MKINHEKARQAIKKEEFQILLKYIEEREQAEQVLRKIVNLSGHPYFPEIKDLPAWAETIQEARNIL